MTESCNHQWRFGDSELTYRCCKCGIWNFWYRNSILKNLSKGVVIEL